MRVLIVEDETAAYENLVDILGEVSYDIQIAANTESVTQTIHWLPMQASRLFPIGFTLMVSVLIFWVVH